MLRWRFILGTLLTAAIVGLCWLDFALGWPGLVLLPLAVAIAMLAVGELLAMFRARGHDPLAWTVYCGTLLTVLAAAAPGLFSSLPSGSPVGRLGWLALGIAIAFLIAAAGEMWRFDSPGRTTTNLAHSVFAIVYIGGLFGFLIQLRLLGGSGSGGGTGLGGHHGRTGMLALVSLILIVKMSDVGQYTVGRLIGRNKIAPRVSPGKTWEGFFGGLAFACLAAWILNQIVPAFAGSDAFGPPGAFWIFVYAIALAVAGIIGDLTESMLKRDAGVKDSSKWLPGFGGVLDLLDSLLVAAPVAYLFWALRLVGT